MNIIGIIFFVLLILVGLSFSLLNATPVEFNYYFGSAVLPLAFALMIALVVGILFGALGVLAVAIKLKRESMRLKKIIRASERELSQLRAAPIQTAVSKNN